MKWTVVYRKNYNNIWVAVAAFMFAQEGLDYAERANIWEPGNYKTNQETVTL